MGLLDSLGGGGDASLYGDMLSPQQKQALAFRGLLGFAGGMAPYLGASRLPVSLGQALAGGAGGMGSAQDEAATNAMRAGLLGLQGKQLQANLSLQNAELNTKQPPLYLPGGQAAPAASTSSAAGAPGLPAASPGSAADLVKHFESGGDYMIGTGGADLSKAPREASGFPIWEGKDGSRAAGAYQFEPATWRQYAKPLGITDFSPASQDAVFHAAYLDQGFKPWAPYNPRLAAALPSFLANANGGGANAPGPASATPDAAPQAPQGAMPTGAGILPQLAGQPAAAPTTGLLATGGGGTPPSGGPQINPAAIDYAQQIARLHALRGVQTPDYLNKMSEMGPGMPLSPQYAGQLEAAKAPYKITSGRPGSIMYDGLGRPIGANPTFQAGAGGFVTPGSNTFQTVPGYAGGVGNIQAAEERAKLGAQNEPMGTPGQAGQPGAAPQIPGTPLTKDYTSTVPDLVEPMLSAEQIKANQPKWAEMNQEMVASIGQSQQAEHRLQNIGQAFKMFQSGAYTEQKADFNALLMQLFGKDTALQLANAPPAEVELALHENYRGTLQTLGAVNKRFTQNEFQITSDKSEHPNLQPEANLNMLAEDIAALRQQRALANDWVKAQIAKPGLQNPEAFQARWMNANGIEKIIPGVKDEIGPLNGMAAPQGLPQGSRQIGTMKGVPVYRSPDGKYFQVQ